MSDVIARAKRDALRSAVFDEWVERRIYAERSLSQMIRAGLRWAMIPRDLELGDLHQLLARLCGAPVCGEVLDEATIDGELVFVPPVWVCLAPVDAPHPSCFELDAHAWPADEVRLAAALALYEQTDPIARIERRVAAALGEPTDHPLVAAFAADMPPA